MVDHTVELASYLALELGARAKHFWRSKCLCYDSNSNVAEKSESIGVKRTSNWPGLENMTLYCSWSAQSKAEWMLSVPKSNAELEFTS